MNVKRQFFAHSIVILCCLFFWQSVSADSTPSAEFKDRRPISTKLKDIFKNNKKENSIIVKFKPNQNENSRRDALSKFQLEQIDSIGDDASTIVVNLDATEDKDNAVRGLVESGKVEYAEQNIKFKADFIPNDSLYSQQWSMPKIKAEQAWGLKPGGYSTVAVIDTGANLTHPDLDADLVAGYDFVNSDNIPEDDNGHGTHVAGIIAGEFNSAAGIAGVGKNAKVMPLKALASNGEGFESDIANAIIYATNHGSKIINLSLGATTSSSTLQNAVNYANSNNVIVVAASGNQGAASLNYPAAYPGVISVGSTNQNDARSSFSNYGAGLYLTAPGNNIVSTYLSGGYANASGTSMASPLVAGAISFAMSDGTTTKSQVMQRLKTSSDKVGSQPYSDGGYNYYYGYGRLNLYNLVTNQTAPLPSQNLIPVYRFWSGSYNHHFYTASESEKNYVMVTWPNVWSYEGMQYCVSSSQTAKFNAKVHRFWSDSFHGHFYTASESEKNYVIATWPNVWSYEGPVFWVGTGQ
jgi:thermitase